MNNVKNRWIYLVAWIMLYNTCNAGFFGVKLFDAENKQPIIVSEHEEKKQRLQVLKDELATVQEHHKQQKLDLKNRQAVLTKEIKALTENGNERARNGFIAKKLTLLNEMQQSLAELTRIHAQHMYVLKQSIEMLEGWINDQQIIPVFAEKASYQLNDFQKLSQQFLRTQEDLNSALSEKKRYETELEQLNQKIVQLEQDLKSKEQIKARFEPGKVRGMRSTEIAHQSELLDLQSKLAQLKKEVALARRIELQKTLTLNALHISIEKEKRAALKKALATVERKVWVTDADMHKAEEALEESKHEHNPTIESLNKLAAELSLQRNKMHKAFEVLNNQLSPSIKDLRHLTEWLTDPQSVNNEVIFYKAALLNQAIQTIDKEIALFQAKQQLHTAYITEREFELDSLKSWLVGARRGRVADDAEQQEFMRQFNEKRAELQKELESLKQKDHAVTTLISAQNRIAQQLQQHIDDVNNHKDALIKRYGTKAYQTIVHSLQRAQEHLNRRLDIYSQLIKVYATLASVYADMNAQLALLSVKLEGVGGIWQRSAGALTWPGVQSAFSDLSIFWEEAVTTIFKTGFAQAIEWGTTFFADPINVFNLILLLLLTSALYFLLLLGVPWLGSFVDDYEKKHGMSFVSRAFGGFLNIIYRHLIGLTLWGTMLYVINSDVIFDFGGHLKLMVYLGSIPYLCYLTHAVIGHYLAWFTVWRPVPFKQLISLVLQIFGFATITVQCVQEAFFATVYGRSEVGTLLSAAQSLITRSTLILLLMNREIVLALLPQRGGTWGTVRTIIDRFYGLCWLIVSLLIILSDPYVGYGKLVSTVVSGIAFSLVLLGLFWLAHVLLKRYSSHLFFSSIGEGTRERFSQAKTWYVVFLICSIVLLVVLTAILFARIWGYTLSFERLSEFFNMELVKIRGETVGQFTSFTINSILLLCGIMLGGFLLSALINRFVWHRVFELLEVDSGVQHTISRITGYLIFIIALIIGLYQIGLGGGVPSGIIFIVAVIAWSVKDPINDFFSYFILLVERSIKIGDYIRLNDVNSEIGGIVRKITPRSVVLRKDNSFYLVIPNSKVLNTPFANWNYGHSYVAFENVTFTVAYQSDPVKVKAIVLAVLAKNSLVLKNPTPVIRIENFGEHGLEFMVRGFISASNFNQQWDIRSDIRFALVAEFRINNIDFAVPQRHIHVTKRQNTSDRQDSGEELADTL